MLVLVFFAIVSSLACLLMVIMPAFTLILAIGWGISLVIGGLYIKRSQLVIVWGINILLLYGLTGDGSLFFYLGFIGLPALVMGLMATRTDQGFYHLLRGGIVAAVVGVSLFMAFAYLNTGDVGMKQLESQMNVYVKESWPWYEDSGVLDFYEQQGISRVELKASLNKVIQGVTHYLPAFYYIEAIFMAAMALYLSSLISRKKNLERLRKKPYIEEIMPWQGAWVVIAGLALWLWGRDNNYTLYMAGANLLAVSLLITAFYGLAGFLYKVKSLKASTRKWTIAIFIFLTVIFPLSAIIFIAILGLFDSLLDYRKLRNKKEEF